MQAPSTPSLACLFLMAALGQVLVPGAVVAAGPPPTDLTGWDRLPPAPENLEVPIPNADFEEGDKYWAPLKSCYRVAPGVGFNGSKGLVCERTDPNEYLFSSRPIPLKAGVRYKVSAWIKTENVQGPWYASFAIEYFKPDGGGGKKYVGGFYPPGLKGTTDWTLVGNDKPVFVPAEGNEDLAFYWTFLLGSKTTGKAYFDNLRILVDGSRQVTLDLLHPTQRRLVAGQPATFTMALMGDCGGKDGVDLVKGDNALAVRAAFARAGKAPVLRSARLDRGLGGGSIITLDTAGLEPGTYNTRFTLFDETRKLILDDSVEMELTVAGPEPAPANACTIDRFGRTLVNGKPWLPVGFICFGINEDDLDVIGNSPFNVLMPYCGMNLGLKNGKCKPGTIGGIREVLDACHARNIKVVFPLNYQFPWLENYPGATNMRFKDVEYSRDWRAWDEAVTTEIVAKAVETLRDHPALLAWYVADEVSPSKSPFLRQRRALINRLDPWHPTWAVYCVEQDLPYHVGTADLIGMDPYPICSNITDTKTIELTSRWMQAVRRVASTDQGVLTWCVPQFFSWGYKDSMTDRDKYLSRYRDPSEVEMRAQCLLMAIHGCRGIIAYNYHHFRAPSIPAAEPDFPRRWAEMCRVGELMKELAPYLLSTKEEDVPVAAESGVVRARLFRGEAGGARVLVVGEGPGKARARLTLPPGAVSKSLYGATTPAEDGTWVFEGTDVCCDVLE